MDTALNVYLGLSAIACGLALLPKPRAPTVAEYINAHVREELAIELERRIAEANDNDDEGDAA